MNNLFTPSHETQTASFVLESVDLYNWGPFGGRHHVDIHPEGSAIIGPTGSGKTTIIDALMTLLVALPRYNLASTGGHDSDRDLMSYLRGLSGAGNDSDNRHVARTGKTVTGISATFARGEQHIELGTIHWIDSTSFNNADRKDLWFVSEDHEQNLNQWLMTHRDGGSRALKQTGRETARLKVFDTKKSYLAHVRRFFEVGANAFTLLNRAAGLKQLNSVDEIFREYVLDDRAAWDRAAEVASEFDALTEIYNELETARKQQHSLVPVETTNQRYLTVQTAFSEVQKTLRILPVWFAITGQRLWSRRQHTLEQELSGVSSDILAAEHNYQQLSHHADACYQRYLEQGGGTIDQLKERIENQAQATARTRQNVDDYLKLTATLGLPSDVDKKSFDSTLQAARQNAAELETQIAAQEDTYHELGAIRIQQTQSRDAINEEITAVERNPGSNIPGNYLSFRADLAQALELAEGTLPYIAELIEVKTEYSLWRGAIERAIGGHRLRLLVPVEQTQQALAWVNQRNNRLHVRLLEASEPTRQPVFMNDGFARNLNFKSHPLREAMKSLLASIDRHCVDGADQLRTTQHGMTKEGLMSGTAGRFEKLDQQPLDQGWVTGFSNKDQLASLQRQRATISKQLGATNSAYAGEKQTLDRLNNHQLLLSQLLQLSFDTIDLDSEEQTLVELKQQLEVLTDPNSDAGKAKLSYDQARGEMDQANTQILTLREQSATLKERLAQVEKSLASATQRVGDGLSEVEIKHGDTTFPEFSAIDVEQLNDRERETRGEFEAKQATLRDELEKLKQRLIRLMEAAKKVDTGALAEADTELQDIPAYVERLRVLNEEALPEKMSRFQTYLTQSSDQGVTQLLVEIDGEVSAIEERIEELNHTLRRVDFQEHRFLRLIPRRVTHESLRTLQRARNQLRSAMLRDDQGDSQYRALENIVLLLREASDNRRNAAARALLDPRYRIQFSYSVIDRQSGDTIEIRTGSQGGSGGEKEIIASYILTASLSYALCPDGSSQPLFGTVVLDEAFSKSSQVVAGRIISALKAFGLHPLFVTPNKEMRLLREHTRSAILVHRKGLNATLTSLSWEALEEQALARQLSPQQSPQQSSQQLSQQQLREET